MATIDSVKLPDNSTYDLTDNYSGYAKKVSSATTDDLASLTATGDLADSGKKLSDLVLKADVKDVLNSTSTTDPLSANMGRVLGENVEAIVDVYSAKNLWDIEGWLNRIGQPFTKSGNIYTTSITDARTNTNKCVFSDTDIEVTLSAPLTASGSMAFYVDLFDSNDQVVGGISLSQPTFTGVGCKVRFNFNSTGTVTLTEPMLRDARITDPTFVPFAKTNLQLTNDKAERADLATLNLTGTTNSTGAQIDEGTYFYLNDSYCKAITNIANGATFTLNTNFEVITVGGELENKLNLVKVAESASGTDTYKNKLNALYSAFNGLSELEKINSFIASYGVGIAPMKLTFSYDKRFAYSSRQAANLLSELYITLDSSNSILCEAVLNSSTNEISINDQSSNNTTRTLYLYTLR